MRPKPNQPLSDGPTSIWEWNSQDGKKKKKKKKRSSNGTQFPVTEFLQEKYKKLQETVLGPGAGAGVGCGVGLGFGLVGGAGFGGWPWNHLKLAFGVGVGCGVGVGFGYGHGIGYGASRDSLLESSGLKKKDDSARGRMLIEI